MSGRIKRVKCWDEFKRLIIEHHPESLAYNIERGIPPRNLSSLRLILPSEGTQYVFLDTVDGERLRKTGIRLHKDNHGNLYLKDEDIANFVRDEVKRKNLKFWSYWTI